MTLPSTVLLLALGLDLPAPVRGGLRGGQALSQFTPPVGTAAARCAAWVAGMLAADADGGGLSEEEFQLFLARIEEPPHVAAYLAGRKTYGALPWQLKAAHKALACRCQDLGGGEGCCEGRAEIPLAGLREEGGGDATTAAWGEFRTDLCGQLAAIFAAVAPPPAAPEEVDVAATDEGGNGTSAAADSGNTTDSDGDDNNNGNNNGDGNGNNNGNDGNNKNSTDQNEDSREEGTPYCSFCSDGVLPQNSSLPESMRASSCEQAREFTVTLAASDELCAIMQLGKATCCPDDTATPSAGGDGASNTTNSDGDDNNSGNSNGNDGSNHNSTDQTADSREEGTPYCSFCPDGVSSQNLSLLESREASCEQAQKFTVTLAASDELCAIMQLGKATCCPGDTATPSAGGSGASVAIPPAADATLQIIGSVVHYSVHNISSLPKRIPAGLSADEIARDEGERHVLAHVIGGLVGLANRALGEANVAATRDGKRHLLWTGAAQRASGALGGTGGAEAREGERHLLERGSATRRGLEVAGSFGSMTVTEFMGSLGSMTVADLRESSTE